MTNFAQPVSMECTEEQYNRDLKDGVEKLGYKKAYGLLRWEEHSMIATRYDSVKRYYGLVGEQAAKVYIRHFIDHYNPELFLAIAAMREGEYVHVGEWMMCLEDTSTGGKRGNLYQVLHISNIPTAKYPRINHFGENFSGNEWWRKATLSELITHFTKKDMIYTLEDLREGKVACVNDGTIQQLKEVLHHCYPDDEYYGGWHCKYYFTGNKGRWIDRNETDLPTQSVKLFHSQLIKEHEFKFGDKVLAWDFEGSTRYDYFFVSKIECEFPYLLADSESWIESLNIGKGCHLVQRKHCIHFPSPLKITRSEIAEWKGTDHFEIVD